MDKFLRYNHTNPKEDSISKFFNRNQAYMKNISLYDFLTFNSNQNIQNIYLNYPAGEQAQYNELYRIIINSKKEIVEARSSEIMAMPLYENTEFLIPDDNLVDELVSVRGKNLFLEQKGMVGFWSEKLTQLITDPDYVPLENINHSDNSGYSVELINESIRVWVWCRALNKIIDVSPFVNQLNINKSDVGSFYFSLNPLSNPEDYYDLDNSDVLNYFNMRNSDGSYQSDYFHNNLQQNDIVFIRFERLKVEKDQNKPFFDFEIRKQQLPNQVWDMIGLIDSNTQENNVGALDYEVNISGRDFTKLLIEDGSYIFHLAYLLGGEEKIIYDGFNQRDKYFKRLFADNNPSYGHGMYEFIGSDRNIADSIGFIVNQISNLGVLGGEDLFSQYLDRRTKAYKISQVADVNEKLSLQEVDGVWQIIKFFIDSQINNRVIVDPSFAQADGTLIEQINKFCQQPFVEFYGDTYGDEFNFIVRQPPFDKASITGFLNGTWNEKSSLEGNTNIIKGGKSPVIDIEEKDVSRFTLEWDETYYSAYQISPQEGVFGKYTNLAVGTIIPIIFFSDIAETLGNHRKSVSDIYLDVKKIEGYREALLNDLKYLIDTNIYLPFTRKGSITLVHGDRRIKRGTFIRFVQTGEIYYVDGVSNSINFSGGSVDRDTVLQVSRGMVEEYIEGYKGWDENSNLIMSNNKPVKFSYFNIVDTDIIVKNIMNDTPAYTEDTYTQESNPDYNVTIPQTSNIAYTNNNPGNLIYAHQTNAVKGAGRLITDKKTFITSTVYWANFDTKENGFKALMNQVKTYTNRDPNIDVRGFVNKYAPSSDGNNVKAYINFICGQLQTASFVRVASLDTFKFAQAIIKKESSSTVSKKEITEPIKQKTETQKIVKVTEKTESDFSLDKQQYDFFLKRKQLNLFKHK